MTYYINTDKCTACGMCREVCMNNAILDFNDLFVIDNLWCTDCGSCAAMCYENAIIYNGLESDHQEDIKIEMTDETYLIPFVEYY